MTMSASVIKVLADVVRRELQVANIGHCMRVDDLRPEDAVALCEDVRENSAGWSAFVLGDRGILGIRPEQAVELRNRKQDRLCLIVPAGAAESATSSLGNSFAVFDLQRSLRNLRGDLLRQLPIDVREPARQALALLRGRAQPSPEQVADYLGAVLASPTVESAGAELWRIGLIPDVGGDQLEERLARNYDSVNRLIRPARAQSSVEDRVRSLGLRPGSVLDALVAYLAGRRLREPGSWLPQLADEPYRGQLTFERWAFAAHTTSDLEEVHLTPFLDRTGTVETWSKLLQPGGAGTQPVAAVGKKKKLGVRWTTTPAKPQNLGRWRVEMIPSAEEFGEEEQPGVELPSVKVAGSRSSASLPLEIELEDMPVRAVQVRVVALDEAGEQLYGTDGRPINGLSQQFWLDDVDEQLPDGRGGRKRETTSNLPLARLRVAVEGGSLLPAEEPGQWTDGEDLRYFAVPLTSKRVGRVGSSAIGDAIELRALQEPQTGGAFHGRIAASDRVRAEALAADTEVEALWKSDEGAAFLRHRKAFFKLLEEQGPRGRVEVAVWTPDLVRRARSYASAYRALLDTGVPAALQIDVVHLTIERSQGEEEALVTLPLHPLRVLWFTAYAELLRHWETEVIAAGKERSRILDLDLLDRVTPLNCPAFGTSPGGETFVFAGNLRFFWGVLLPAGAIASGRRLADVAAALGFDREEQTLAGIPTSRVAAEIKTYRDVHPYLEVLRLTVVNPGSGRVVADALRALYSPDIPGAEAAPADSLRLDIVAHVHAPLPLAIPALADFQKELYETQPQGRHHLAPLMTTAVRPYDAATDGSTGAVNVAVLQDLLGARLSAVLGRDEEDSSSFYGLLLRLLPDFSASGSSVAWRHRISLPVRAPRERHPVSGPLTNELVDLQRSHLEAVARRLPGWTAGAAPALFAEVSPSTQALIDAIHQDADWVITLDRYYGAEYLEAMGRQPDPGRQYLLNHAPEFLDGIGHRMLVTTAHRGEVELVLARAMADLGFGAVEESVGAVLDHLRAISGRLALRVVGDEAHAREAVGLGVVAAHLRSQGVLGETILVPVDAHPELFAPHARRNEEAGTRARCDLLLARFQRGRMILTLIEVKARTAAASEDLLNRMVDQVEATERVFRDLFFRTEPPRLDHVLQRSRLANLLRFYLHRATRNRLLVEPDRIRELEEGIARLGSSIPELRVERRGYIVNLFAGPQPLTRQRDTEFRWLTARDVVDSGLSVNSATLHGASAAPFRGGEPADAGGHSQPGPSATIIEQSNEN